MRSCGCWLTYAYVPIPPPNWLRSTALTGTMAPTRISPRVMFCLVATAAAGSGHNMMTADKSTSHVVDTLDAAAAAFKRFAEKVYVTGPQRYTSADALLGVRLAAERSAALEAAVDAQRFAAVLAAARSLPGALRLALSEAGAPALPDAWISMTASVDTRICAPQVRRRATR